MFVVTSETFRISQNSPSKWLAMDCNANRVKGCTKYLVLCNQYFPRPPQNVKSSISQSCYGVKMVVHLVFVVYGTDSGERVWRWAREAVAALCICLVSLPHRFSVWEDWG